MSKVDHLRWIGDIWSRRKGLVIMLFLLTLLSSAVAVAYPFMSKLLLDTIQGLLAKPETVNPMAEVDRLLWVILAVGLAGFVASLFPGIRGVTNSIFEHVIRTTYFKKILAKDHGFFSRYSTGDLVTRLTDDIYDFPKLSWFLCSGIFRAVESITKVLFCLVAMVLLNPGLTFWSLIPVPLMILIFTVTQHRIYDRVQQNQAAISAVNTQLEMSFSGVRIIKAYACEEKYHRFFADVLKVRWNTEMALARLEVVLRLIYQYIDYIAQAGIVIAGGIMAVRGEISIGTFYAFYTYLSMLIYPILDIPQLFVSGKRAFVNIDRLEEVARYPDPPRPEATVRVDTFSALVIDKVSFAYGDREGQALSDIDLAIGRGERIGIIGPVGAGKSTLLKLILGLVPPTEGRVLVNGTPIDHLDLESYRNLAGYVPQEALLFSGTLKDNVDFGTTGDHGEDHSGDEVFDHAVTTAQMKAEIADFPKGADTVVGQRGVSLSGGQKQRMAIARAIARKPQLMLFDDITASLDAANEERLMEALKRQSPDLTCLIVSHRLSTLNYVDRVVFMDRGRIEAAGRHQDLMGLPAYRAFIQEHLGREE